MAVLLEARRSCTLESPPTVLAGCGVENVSRSIDELTHYGLLRRPLAMTDPRLSNAMIEAWWRAFKLQWLSLSTLDSVEKTRKLVGFYVEEHDQRLPHSAFAASETRRTTPRLLFRA